MTQLRTPGVGERAEAMAAEDFGSLPKLNCVTVSVRVAGIGLHLNTGCAREVNICRHRHPAFARIGRF
jgi:hypothetical protein